jgi:hypothetical protein
MNKIVAGKGGPPRIQGSCTTRRNRRSGRRAARAGLLLVLFDEVGREVLYRGVNARVAGLFDVTFSDGRQPVETVPPFGEADCRFLSEELGMNVLRLPVNWSGIEPQRGTYDRAYLQHMVQLVDDCF